MSAQPTRIEAQFAEGALNVLKAIESQIDSSLNELSALDDQDVRKLRIQRMKELQKEAQMKELWRIQGHGILTECADQKQWFEEVKNNQRVVCHFYRPTSECCEILDKHLEILARKHMETKFMKINAEKAPYLAQRLHIEILPTLILTKDNFTEDRIEGFDQLGGTMHFPTHVLEKRLARKSIIDLDLDQFEQQISREKREHERAERFEEEEDDW